MGMDLMDIAVLGAKNAGIETELMIANNRNNALAALRQEHNSLIDKYNKVVENCEAAKAARDCLTDIVRDNLDVINVPRDEINERIRAAEDAAVQRVRDSIS